MALQNIVKTLKREVTANPKKGLVLALLLVVGVWFWGPLVKKWVFKPTAEAVEDLVIAPEEVPAEVPAAVVTPKLATWDKVEYALEKNELAQPLPVNNVALLKNPFVKAALASTEVADAAEAEPPMVVPPVEHVEPTQVGLVATSVSIGPQRRFATLRGQVFLQGSPIPVLAADAPTTTEQATKFQEPFVLARVEPWGIVLTRNGKEYQQVLPQPRLKKFDRIAWEANAELTHDQSHDAE